MSAVAAGTRRGFGDGPLSRFAAAVYWGLALQVLLLLTSAPALVVLGLLARDPSNAPLACAALLTAAPGVSATAYAWRARRRGVDVEDGVPRPARWFWRGFRLGWADALRSGALAALVLVVVSTNLVGAGAGVLGLSGVAFGVFAGVQVALALAVVVHALAMTVVTSAFAFRWRDAVRVTLVALASRPLAVLGVGSVVVLGVAAAVLGEWLLWVGGSLLVLHLVRVSEPVVAEVGRRFVTDGS